ncbi:sigma-E processing peptidase SpoIIGA [Metaclostridioides mangenotii]|uniref:sigma-E processing peptidase SpoIIGA n=2 Tax=Metaclostridioides mangenotii TaxID=1540 RepID=UPI00214A6729|nr:sigma-E processing peptidase SpoIIGA [Clostridioides mangenotii]
MLLFYNIFMEKGDETMYYEYYVLENLIVNYIIISCTSILTKKYNSLINKILGAVLGAVYAVAYLYPSLSILFTIPLKILLMTFIIFISFKHYSKMDFLKTSLVFYLVNVFISGTTYFIIYFTGISHMKISFLIVCAYTSCELLKHIYKDIKMIKYIDNLTKNVKIKLFDNEFDCRALVDSGNMLKDPFSKSEVVMVDASVVKSAMPSIFFGVDYSDLDIIRAEEVVRDLDKKISKKVRLIPYKHAGSSESKIVLGFKAEYIEIDNQKIGDIVLGIADLEESDYKAIMSPNLLPNI